MSSHDGILKPFIHYVLVWILSQAWKSLTFQWNCFETKIGDRREVDPMRKCSFWGGGVWAGHGGIQETELRICVPEGSLEFDKNFSNIFTTHFQDVSMMLRWGDGLEVERKVSCIVCQTDNKFVFKILISADELMDWLLWSAVSWF